MLNKGEEKFLRTVAGKIREHGGDFEEVMRERERENSKFAFFRDEKVRFCKSLGVRATVLMRIWRCSYLRTTSSGCSSTRNTANRPPHPSSPTK